MILAKRCQLLGLAAALWAGQSEAIPMDPNVQPVAIQLPSELAGYQLLVDHSDSKILYVQPREGRLGVISGQPQLSFATVVRNGETYGVLNAMFDFSLDSASFEALKTAVKAVDPAYILKPMPYVQTKPKLAIAGYDAATDDGACFEAEDFVTGETIKQCFNLVYKSNIAQNGPTLGEKIHTSLVLSPIGAELFPKLLKGGAGLGMNLDVLYRAAHPAYTATINVDYEKLYESYAWFAGFHDGLCIDIAISDFFERESLCGENGKNANGRECSVRVEYVDQHGNKQNNMFTIVPDGSEPAAVVAFYNENKSKIETLQSAIETLQKKFEEEMLAPYQGRKAEVSKETSIGFTLRADRTRTEIEKHFTLERKTVGGAITKSSTIPASVACLDVDGTTGDVTRYLSGDCGAYWTGTVRVAEVLPVTPELEKSEETTWDWN